FLLRALVREDADDASPLRVWRSYRDGGARIPGFLEDHAALGVACLALHELTFDARWLHRARRLADACVVHFWDDGTNSFHDTADDAEQLVVRPRDPTDQAAPSGTSLATELLARLGDILADADYRRRATFVAESLAEPMAQHPTAFGHLLGVADLLAHGSVELAIIGEPGTADVEALQRAAGSVYVPPLVLAGGPPRDDIALLEGRSALQGRATAYVCRNYACEAPACDAGALAEQLRATRGLRAGTPRP
nr:thioredoxin domain-containing protein [Gemmatimonadaceae bacterium]